MKPTIAILTDFGARDPSVGVMKGVMRTICPAAEFIDLSHEIAAQNLRQAAFTLMTGWRWFPPGTVFLVVVDPGVGSERRPLAVAAGGMFFVAPDNGVLSWTLAELQQKHAVAAENAAWHLDAASHTFHGRDVFAPLAAHLACGRTLDDLGPTITELQRLPDPVLQGQPGALTAEVLQIDHFGNLVTSLGNLCWTGADKLGLEPRFGAAAQCVLPADSLCISSGNHAFTGVRRTYSAVSPGEAVAYIGSSGFLEVAVNQGNAANRFGIQVGDRIEVTWPCSNS